MQICETHQIEIRLSNDFTRRASNALDGCKYDIFNRDVIVRLPRNWNRIVLTSGEFQEFTFGGQDKI